MFIKNSSLNKTLINQKLIDETIEDITINIYRLYKGNCQVTRNKINKIMREGGHVEAMLNIYASDSIISQDTNIINDLMLKANNKAWWNIRTAMINCLKKYDIQSSWEHVTPVKLCIEECEINYKKMCRPAFDKWVLNSIQDKWNICLVTKQENSLISKIEMQHKRNINNISEIYALAGIKKVHHIRNSLV
jgi:hypothetical protein